MTTDTATLPAPRVTAKNGIHVGGLLGYGAIWAFMIVFLIYPLLHLFYDAFTTDTGAPLGSIVPATSWLA